MMTFFHFRTKLNLAHSAISTYSPRLTGEGTNLSSQLFFTEYTDVCSPSKKGSLFRKFNELNRVITIQGVRCGFYQLDIRSSVNNNARDFSCSIKTSQHIH